MKISTKGRYGLRIMLELALCNEKNLLPVKVIAERQDISEKYIEQIIAVLNKSGLVRSQRGAAGGYRLAALPEEITVGAILRATEGDFDIVECLNHGSNVCERRDECITIEIWERMKEAIEEIADSVTLADLVQNHKDKIGFSYMI